MKDKEARTDIRKLWHRVDTLADISGGKLGELHDDIKELREELAEVRKLALKEPIMYAIDFSNRWVIVPSPTSIPLARAIRLILKHLNMQIHGIAEGYELKEIVDDDETKD